MQLSVALMLLMPSSIRASVSATEGARAAVETTQQQDGTVKGVVVNDLGEPVFGARVSVIGSNNSVTTDVDGQFELQNVAKGATVRVVYAGFRSADQKWNGKELKFALLQENVVTGTVYDAATNVPIPGVRVQATGHKRVTTMTDAEGKYKLAVPSYVTLLTFSTTDYLTVQKPVGNRDVINVRLYSDKFQENYSQDVLITSEREFEEGVSAALTIDSDIQNKLGADVRTVNRSATPGIGAAMFIRGLNSLNANTQPLIVVDGVIWDLQEGSESIHMGIYNNILSAIDVNDIRDVKVIKNGAAIYGARAANGVIVINTKRGESMATRITANIFANVALQPGTYNMLGTEDYRVITRNLFISVCII